MADTNEEFDMHPVLTTEIDANNTMHSHITYNRQFRFESSLCSLTNHPEEVIVVKLRLSVDDEDTILLNLEVTGIDVEGEMWEEEEVLVAFLDLMDATVAFDLLSLFLPTEYPQFKWTFANDTASGQPAT